MISDNYVTGDNVYLRELQNFFFEVLGMMSVTHYGAIGDGRTDNYGPLQVAIDDANRRGLSYVYVPYGRFIYTGELINMDNITFVGNPHSKIINIRTQEEIPIEQFGVNSSIPFNYNDANNKPSINGVTLVGNKTSADLHINTSSTKKGAITACLADSTYTLSDGLTNVIPLTEYCKAGSDFSISNDGKSIVVGENIHHVEISAHCIFNYLAGVNTCARQMHIDISTAHDYIATAGGSIDSSIVSLMSNPEINVSPIIAEVSSGSLIQLIISGQFSGGDDVIQGGSDTPRTYITVKAID